MNMNMNWVQVLTIVPMVLVIIGWFVEQHLNRKNEIAKEARSYRLEMLHSVIKFRNDFVMMQKFCQQLFDDAYIKMQLYGLNDEKAAFENLRIEMMKSQNGEENQVSDCLIKMAVLCVDKIRKELNLE